MNKLADVQLVLKDRRTELEGKVAPLRARIAEFEDQIGRIGIALEALNGGAESNGSAREKAPAPRRTARRDTGKLLIGDRRLRAAERVVEVLDNASAVPASRGDLQRKLGLSPNQTRTLLVWMQEQGTVETIGRKAGTKYRLKSWNAAPAPPDPDR